MDSEGVLPHCLDYVFSVFGTLLKTLGAFILSPFR